MKQVFLIPKEGVKVRDPVGNTHIPPEGDFRMLNSYYNRRINSGDLIMRDSESPAAPPAEVVTNNSNASESSAAAKNRRGEK